MHINNGWFDQCRSVPSPNFNQRPDPADISLLVIHSISLPPRQFGSSHIEQFFCNRLDRAEHPYFASICDMEVSSHLLIDRQGQLVQFVSLLERAWHAGQSCFERRKNCNDFSIGIELEGSDDDPFTDAQYQQLSAVTRRIMLAFPAITPARIVGHSDIAPGRKTDPGPHFDWQRFRDSLNN